MSYHYLKEESVFPPYLQFPEFLMNLPISQTAKITYMVLYNRARLSQKNKWLDEEGRIFIIFPIKEICKKIGKGETVVKQALNDLDIAGLLKRKSGGFSKPNHIYIRIPHSSSFSASDGNTPFMSMGKQLSEIHKTVSTTVGLTIPNKVIETKNKKQSNRTNSFVTNNFGKTMKSAMPDYSCVEGESL